MLFGRIFILLNERIGIMKELLKLNDVYVEIKENMLLEKMNVTVKQGMLSD